MLWTLRFELTLSWWSGVLDFFALNYTFHFSAQFEILSDLVQLSCCLKSRGPTANLYVIGLLNLAVRFSDWLCAASQGDLCPVTAA